MTPQARVEMTPTLAAGERQRQSAPEATATVILVPHQAWRGMSAREAAAWARECELSAARHREHRLELPEKTLAVLRWMAGEYDARARGAWAVVLPLARRDARKAPAWTNLQTRRRS